MDSDSDDFVVEGQDESFGEENSDSDSSSRDEDEYVRDWLFQLQLIKENDSTITWLNLDGEEQNVTEEEWEEIGRDTSNNTHLRRLDLCGGAVNDHKMSFLFRGLTRSSSIKDLWLYENELSVTGVRCMVPFLQNANNLTHLDLKENNLQSEGFNELFRALRDSPIEELLCDCCGIESIEIDCNQIPRCLKKLFLTFNFIKADGCRELAKLLQGGDATLESLSLNNNQIDDNGVEILVDALQNNTSLKQLYLFGNPEISNSGEMMLLKLVNDISSIEATLRSNQTLGYIYFRENISADPVDKIQQQINVATRINVKSQNDPDGAGKAKVIQIQLHSVHRADLCRLQGVDHSVYSEIDPLHLPEVLALVGHYHDQGEVYVALLSSIMALFSTMNQKKCIQQERAYHAAKAAEHTTKVEELDAKLALLEEEAAVRSVGVGNINHRRYKVESDESRSNKRRRKWWWGLWG